VRRIRLLRALLGTGMAVAVVAAIARHGFPGPVPLIDVGLFNAIYLISAMLCWHRQGRTRPQTWAWRLLAAAMALSAAGNLYYALVLNTMPEPPYPSIADAFSLTWYPLVCLAVLLLLRRGQRRRPSRWLDGLVAGLGAAAVFAAVAGTNVLSVAGVTHAATLVNLAYPVADLVLLAVLIGVVAVLGSGVDRTLALVLIGLATTCAADVAFLVGSETYVGGGLVDLTWLVGVSLLALSAGRDQAGTQRAPDADGVEPAANSSAAGVTWRMLAVPAASALLSLGLLGAGQSIDLPVLAGWLAVACIAAALARAALTFRELGDLTGVHAQARTDDLTGLPNRRALYEQCESMLEDASPATPLSLLMLDLDRFKEVNDALGHSAGDELLVQVGDRVRGIMRPGDLLARLGGDEFAMLLPRTDSAAASAIGQQWLSTLNTPFLIDSISLHVNASIGTASAPDPASTRSELLRFADVAMYDAKAGGTGVATYTEVDRANTPDRLRILEDLRDAMDPSSFGATGAITIHLQPQVSLRPRAPRAGGPEHLEVTGMEALVRWEHPARGRLTPDQFLPLAEAAGLMDRLADIVLDQALATCRRWWDAGLHLPVSVNLCAADVHNHDLPRKITSALRLHGLPPRALVIELTEDTLMADPVLARTILAAIRDCGVAVSIDDYGTGYSSLAYLRNLAVDELKLDRVFVADLTTDPACSAIVRHTVDLAHSLGLRLVAEGIEDQLTAAMLTGFGCDIGQGFHFARPMPPEEALSWLFARGRGEAVTAGGTASRTPRPPRNLGGGFDS